MDMDARSLQFYVQRSFIELWDTMESRTDNYFAEPEAAIDALFHELGHIVYHSSDGVAVGAGIL